MIVSDSPAEQKSVFYYYQHRLRLDGIILWRRVFAESGVFLMNAISSKTLQLVSNSFEHVEYRIRSGNVVTITLCSCSVYKHMYDSRQQRLQSGETDENRHDVCVHGRFVLTYLKDLCLNPKLLKADNRPALYKNIASRIDTEEVVVLPECEEKRTAIKMSVEGAMTDCFSMCHICPDREKVSCTNMACGVMYQNKKGSAILQVLTDKAAHTLCPHLRQLLKFKDKWTKYLSANITENTDDTDLSGEKDTEFELDDADVHFDHDTGHWIYSKALGQSVPSSEDCISSEE